MKIEIWSDFICPFCYIGKRKMELALDQFSQKERVRVVYKSYELDPHSEKEPDMDVHSFLSHTYGMSTEKTKEMNESLRQEAKEVGLIYHFDTMQYANTLDAHRLVQYANKEGKGNLLTEALLYAHFTDSKNISDHDALVEIGSRLGLNENNIMDVLESKKYKRHVRDDEEQAEEIGIKTVPYFVFNETYGIAGAHPVEVLLDVLEQVQKEEEENQDVRNLTPDLPETKSCTGEGCATNPDNEE